MGSSAEHGYKGPKPYSAMSSEASQEFLNGLRNFSTVVTPKGPNLLISARSILSTHPSVSNLLRVGGHYHRAGLPVALMESKIWNSAVEIRYAEPIVTYQGQKTITAFNFHAVRGGKLIAVVGIREAGKIRSKRYLDGVVKADMDSDSDENGLIAVGIELNGDSITIFKHPEYEGERTLSIEDIFPRVSK